MGLKRQYDKVEEIPEAQRELYVQEDSGKYRLDVDDDLALGLKQSLHSEREDHKATKGELAGLKSTIDGQAAELDKLRTTKPTVTKTPDVDIAAQIKEAVGSVTTQLEEKHARERDELVETNKRDRLLMEHTTRENAANEAIAAHDGIPRLLKSEVMGHLKVVEDDGKMATRVVDDAGQELITRIEGKTGLMEAQEYVGLLAADKDFAGAFRTSVGSGGGATPGSAGSASSVSKPIAKMTDAEKIAFVDEHGQDVYLAKVSEELARNPMPMTIHGTAMPQSGPNQGG